MVIFLAVWALRHAQVFAQVRDKYQHSGLDSDEQGMLMQKIEQLMQDQKLYLDPALSLQSLSSQTGSTTRQISQAINQQQGENFNQYLARYRVAAAQAMLHDPQYSHYKVSAIALESGFNSISTFNSAFKKHTGMTAVSFRKSGKNHAIS